MIIPRAAEVAQQVRALVSLAKDPDSVPAPTWLTDMHNSSSRGYDSLLPTPAGTIHTHDTCTYM